MTEKLLLVGSLLIFTQGFQGIKACTRGFPSFPSSLGTRDYGGNTDTAVTIIIPEMNFTCNATIAGFIFAGINRVSGSQDPMIQIWRENISQPAVYYKTGPAIALNISADHFAVCDDGLPKITNRTFLCVLKKEYRVLIQSGDILGFEMPPSSDDDFDILFMMGGPRNYIFQELLNSTVDLSNHQMLKLQLPQITFSFTSDQCTSGFPDVSPNENLNGQGDNAKVTTQLFPDLRFGCIGTIVRMVVAVDNKRGQHSPKIQVWREDKAQTGIYHRQGAEIQIIDDNPACIRDRRSHDIFRCTLNETFGISVQPGDILGLELPPRNDVDFDIYFTPGGPTSYIFEGKLNCTVNISEAADESNYLPQISLVVTLEVNENAELPTCTNPSPSTTAQSHVSQVNPFVGVTVGSTIAVIIILLLCFMLISVIFLLYKNKRNSPKRSLNGTTHAVYSHGHLYQANVSESQCLQTSALTNNMTMPAAGDDDIMAVPGKTSKEPEYYELNDSNYKAELSSRYEDSNQALVRRTVDQEAPQCDVMINNGNHEYHYLEREDEKGLEKQAPCVLSEDDDYWEPANSVNELYNQLCSKKYREIVREQVEIGDSIGSGQFGVVSKGMWESPKGAMDVAVKQLQPGASEEEKVKFLQEAAINGQFRHPNLVMLMGVVTVGEPKMIVLELLTNGDLRSFLIQLQPKSENPEDISIGVTEDLLLNFCQHIASGMSYLASKSFVHRDLAARNILVSKDKICKISDFGMSRSVVDDTYVSQGGKVPVKWTAPEAICYKKYSTASDVWSFGCVMHEIWSLGHKPFEQLSNVDVIKRVNDGYRLPPPPGTPKEVYKIMIECWQPDSCNRPTFPQLVELLSRADFELFAWEEEDLRDSDPLQIKTIGAPLETAKNLYLDLQKSYITQD